MKFSGIIFEADIKILIMYDPTLFVPKTFQENWWLVYIRADESVISEKIPIFFFRMEMSPGWIEVTNGS